MNDTSKEDQINTFLQEPVLARLGTANLGSCQPHVTPVWFLWDGESVWISAFNSTRKVKELTRNPLCSVLIDETNAEGKTRAVLLEGEAELISEPRELVAEMSAKIYLRYLGPEGVLAPDPQSWIKDPENTIVKLTPQKTFSWFW